jgi:hypothetical protein
MLPPFKGFKEYIRQVERRSVEVVEELHVYIPQGPESNHSFCFKGENRDSLSVNMSRKSIFISKD